MGTPDLAGRERLVVAPIIAAMLALGLAPAILTHALDDVARQVTLTVSQEPEAAASGVVSSGDSGADSATEAPAVSTATEGNAK